MNQTYATDRISRLNEELSLSKRENMEQKRVNEALRSEISELKQAHSGTGNAEIGLNIIYMEKLDRATKILDELISGLGKAKDASESIRGNIDLPDKLRAVCDENAGDIKGMLMDLEEKIPSQLGVENKKLYENMGGQVEQFQTDLTGILNKILDFLGRISPNWELERETLLNLNTLIKRQIGVT